MSERAASFVSPVRAPGALAVVLLGLIGLMALVGPLLVPCDPIATDPPIALRPPSSAHPFGTDQLGRDVFSRVIVSARIDLGIAFTAVIVTLVIGTALGAAAGWAGGWTDRIVSRLMDTIMAFPLFVLAVGIAAALGNSVSSVVIATVIVNLPLYARQARTEVNRRRGAAYVEAARLAGIGPFAIVGLHIMPNLAPQLIVQASLNLGWAILNAAGLSFLGLGIRPPNPEWGIMVAEGGAYIISGEWWLFVFPGAMLFLAVLTFSLTGDALRDRLDPRRA
ncbi:MAG: ABC transporter permease [Xanthobacteraceae bacterium]|jgi:peptide/nickel transport system permease protein